MRKDSAIAASIYAIVGTGVLVLGVFTTPGQGVDPKLGGIMMGFVSALCYSAMCAMLYSDD